MRVHRNIDNLDFQVSDALLIEHKETFDKMVCVDVSEHFSYRDGQILLEKTDITLRKGVAVILAGFGPSLTMISVNMSG
jgi:cyclopropane fatty-acyl-phospholipid synthase-like methyltransferase